MRCYVPIQFIWALFDFQMCVCNAANFMKSSFLCFRSRGLFSLFLIPYAALKNIKLLKD